MFDYPIEGGTVVDGTGVLPTTADVAIEDGKIVEVGERISGAAAETIDADGALVTPGWVDVHTHYDGQVSWDDEIAPSSHNGVTTVVMGNCGVGFAPVAPGQELELIELMEGVEDIPGSALHEGVDRGAWQSFPEYMDYIASRRFALDVGAQIAHGAVRFHAMGERGRLNEDATADVPTQRPGRLRARSRPDARCHGGRAGTRSARCDVRLPPGGQRHPLRVPQHGRHAGPDGVSSGSPWDRRASLSRRSAGEDPRAAATVGRPASVGQRSGSR